MSELDRLIEIARALPPLKVHALLTVAEQMTDYVSDDEFLRKINSAPAIDVDDETAAELRLALAERGATISHEKLKRELGLA
ncbi:MAG: hypothetical protein HY235_30010 [Acidobacteria bacterium]|nr:hypothetical protein [Acidobacteriota bacterium]